MTKVDCLIEVAKKLKEARILGEACSDRALLYFIDMTIVHVCELSRLASRVAKGRPSPIEPCPRLSVGINPRRETGRHDPISGQ